MAGNRSQGGFEISDNGSIRFRPLVHYFTSPHHVVANKVYQAKWFTELVYQVVLFHGVMKWDIKEANQSILREHCWGCNCLQISVDGDFTLGTFFLIRIDTPPKTSMYIIILFQVFHIWFITAFFPSSKGFWEVYDGRV